MKLEDRFSYDGEENILFINLSDLEISTSRQIQELDRQVKDLVESLAQDVYAVVNYDNCEIADEVSEEFNHMLKQNQEKYSKGTVRYSNLVTTRVALNTAGVKEKMKSNICKSREEAIEKVKELKKVHSE